jgi:HlyD family secretion protein
VANARQELEKDQATLARAKAGQEDPTLTLQLEYEQALAGVDRARKAVDDLKSGADSAAVRAAKTAYEAAKARVEDCQSAIAQATLTAPADGLVFAVFAQAGQQVEPNAQAVYLADPKDLRVQAQATEMDITRLSVGQEVRLSFDAYAGRVFQGKILTLPAGSQDAGGMSVYMVETSLEQGDAQLWPGLGATVRVVIGEKKDVLIVPTVALRYRMPDETYVVVRTADGKPHDQKVKIGLNDGIVAEVLDGLSEGQTVVIPLVPPLQPRPGFYGPMG